MCLAIFSPKRDLLLKWPKTKSHKAGTSKVNFYGANTLEWQFFKKIVNCLRKLYIFFHKKTLTISFLRHYMKMVKN
jgi:hypothetical protein